MRAYAVDDAAYDEVWIWLQACGEARAKSPADLEQLASTASDLGIFAAQWASAPPSRDRYPWPTPSERSRSAFLDMESLSHSGDRCGECWLRGPLIARSRME